MTNVNNSRLFPMWMDAVLSELALNVGVNHYNTSCKCIIMIKTNIQCLKTFSGTRDITTVKYWS